MAQAGVLGTKQFCLGIVEEEVTLGCHQGALMVFGLEAPHIDLPSAMCFLRIRRWLMECGTPLDHRHLECTVSSAPWKLEEGSVLILPLS